MIYFAILFVLIILTYLEFLGKDFCILGNKQIEKVAYVSAAVFLTLFASLRFETGRDWQGYKDFFSYCERIHFTSIESGYKLLNVLFKTVTDNYYVVQFMIVLICAWVIFRYIYKKSSKPIFTLLCYYMLEFTCLSMALQRQLLAVAILILGMKFVEQKKIFYWCVIVLLAMQFHITALAAFPLYYTTGVRLSKRNAMIFLLSSLVFGLVGVNLVRSIIRFIADFHILPQRICALATLYMSSTHGRRVGYGSIAALIGHTTTYLLVLWQYNANGKNIDSRYMFNFLISVLCLQLGRNFEELSRLQYYYNLCGCGILSYNLLDTHTLKLKSVKLEKRTHVFYCFVLLTMFIVIYGAAFYMGFYHGSGALQMRNDYFNYKTFLFRE